MQKTHKGSRFEFLNGEEIEANNESEYIMVVQIEQVLTSDYGSDLFLCEMVDRETHENIKKLQEDIEKLAAENAELLYRAQTAENLQNIYKERKDQATEQIERMRTGFKEIERVFGKVPPEVAVLFGEKRIPGKDRILITAGYTGEIKTESVEIEED